MDFKITSEKKLADGTKRFFIQVQNNELIYLGYFLESFEGWCNYTTPNRNEPILQVDVTPDFIDEFE
ncbi:MAG: hypothetical protein KAU01_08145, partial [Candidatus Cloacimonetes bacterium]|nr:hypothetical protein [Candidatus Cloacimonadota bacterium]